MVHYVDLLGGFHPLVLCNDFETIITMGKVECTITFNLLAIELKCRFLDYELMNVLGVIYYLQPNCESIFATHLNMIKWHYCTSNKLGTFSSWF
jgi:hypothetical protein